MIKIHFTSNSLAVQGHAVTEGAPPGCNIICAAVSALTVTLLDGLEEVAKMPFSCVCEPGNVCVNWQEANDTGKALIDTWYRGIRLIQEEYGQIEFK